MVCAAIITALVLTVTCLSTVHAQVRPDSVRTDTLRRPGAPLDSQVAPGVSVDSAARELRQRRIDSIVAFRRIDTIKAPFVNFEMPRSFELDDRLRFNRTEILSSGATNLADLLDRVPGVTTYRTGWLASVHVAAFLGDFARVRVFMDGVEMDANDARSNGILDLVDVPLWTMDEIVIERAAGETRVWCRTSTVTRTTPYTRTDVFTGDLNTNGFRGLFARRFGNGMALQVNGQQYATQQGRSSAFGTTKAKGKGDGGNQTLSARVGMAKRRWSIDAYGTVITRDRDGQAGLDSAPDVAAYKAARREGYVRFGYGDSTNGLWSQLILSSLRTRLEGIRPDTLRDTTVRSDTTRSREQKVLAVGYRTKAMQLSFTERLRTFGGNAYSSPAIRAAYALNRVSAGVFVEKTPLDSSQHADVSVKFTPFPWLGISGGQSLRMFDAETARDNETVTRIQAGVNWNRWWLTGGVMQQSAFQQVAPSIIVGAVPRLIADDGTGGNVSSTAVTFGAHGPLYKALSLDMQGIRWNNSLLYRPQLSVRTDLGLVTNWLSRFPRGEFGFNAHIIHELRDPITFPYAVAATAGPVYVQSPRAQVYTALVEIRIQRAVLFYQFHNMSGQPYQLTPGIPMPRQVQMYGVRWEFWN